MGQFGVLLIAVDRYPDPPGSLPSSVSARRLIDILTRDRGGRLTRFVPAESVEDVLAAFEEWAGEQDDRPLSSIVYLVGHGTNNFVNHSFIAPAPNGRTRELRTSTLSPFFERDWTRRQQDPTSWTLFVLDCCASDVGTTNLINALTQSVLTSPRRLALWPVTPRGASHSGRFVDAFERAISTFSENDEVIPLIEVFRRMKAELGDLEPSGFLPFEAALNNPLHSPTPVVMSMDAHAELKRVIAGLPAEVRNHFLTKAQGAETGDLARYFCGRDEEIVDLSNWLRNAPGGMRVVTGEAGSGKSALLGHLVVLSNDELRGAYAAAGLGGELGDLERADRPPSSVFDAALHLTGCTMSQTLQNFRTQAAGRFRTDAWATTNAAITGLQEGGERVTILVDALDEAQEPEAIAEFLREAAMKPGVRVLVGTRRSLSEGPDRPAAPDRRELLDALGILNDNDVVVVERDRQATKGYLQRRLAAPGSPYAGRGRIVDALADRIASVDQPFLFARLAVSELLARPAVASDSPVLDELLAHGHRGIFIAALVRLGAKDRDVTTMLRALALARGRGVPETGGTWIAMARGLDPNVIVPDDAVRRALDKAAPYVMLDGEGGQSVYRLSHRTFAEHFRSDPDNAAEHRRAAAALLALVAQSGGWRSANYYIVRYLAEHFTAELDRMAADVDGLSELATDPEWLARAGELLSADGLVETLATARRGVASSAAETVERVLRRSRIALGGDIRQLAGQVHARLHVHPDPRLAGLGDAVAKARPDVWLRMRNGTLDWRADLETTYGFGGRIRALAFGQIDERPILAIGADDKIRLWDPRRGAGDVRIIDSGSAVTALALSTLNGRPVIVAAVRDATPAIVIRDARTGAIIWGPLLVPHRVDALALGRSGDRTAIAASGAGAMSVWDVHTATRMTELPTTLSEEVRGVSVRGGALVAHVIRRHGADNSCRVVDIATGADIWREPRPLNYEPRVIAGSDVGDRFVAAASLQGGYEAWLPAHPLEPCLGDKMPRLRAVAVGEVEGRFVLAYAPDYATTALVSIKDGGDAHADNLAPVPGKPRDAVDAVNLRSIQAFVALRRGDDGAEILGLTTRPLALVTPDAGTLVDAAPAAATITLALTGVADSRKDFRDPSDPARLRLPPPPRGTPARFELRNPRPWPRTTVARGFVKRRPIIATGSILGCVWLWNADATKVIGGPFTELPAGRKGWGRQVLHMHGGASEVTSVALGRHPSHGDMLAMACNGHVRLVALPSGAEIASPTGGALVITSVALGRLLGKASLVTGSQGGVVIVWDLATGARVAALTLDRGIDRVWVVHGADMIAVRTAEAELFILEVCVA
jgi:WD40 repeat protein